jgi:hypothetical protein
VLILKYRQILIETEKLSQSIVWPTLDYTSLLNGLFVALRVDNGKGRQEIRPLLGFFFLFLGSAESPPSALQPFEAYCAKSRFSSPVHLQRRSTSEGMRDLY